MSWVVERLKLAKKRANIQAHASAYIAFLTYSVNSGDKTPTKGFSEFLPFPQAEAEARPSIFEKALSPEGYSEYVQALKNKTFKPKTHALLIMFERQSKKG